MGLFLFLCYPEEMGHFIVSVAIEFAAAILLTHPAPLFEEERHFSLLAFSYICSKQYTYPS